MQEWRRAWDVRGRPVRCFWPGAELRTGRGVRCAGSLGPAFFETPTIGPGGELTRLRAERAPYTDETVDICRYRRPGMIDGRGAR